MSNFLVLTFSGESGFGKSSACRVVATDEYIGGLLREYFGGDYLIRQESFAKPLKDYLSSLVGLKNYKEMSWSTDTKDMPVFGNVLGGSLSYRNFCQQIADETKKHFSEKIFAFGLYLRVSELVNTCPCDMLVLIDDLRYPVEMRFLENLAKEHSSVDLKHVYVSNSLEMTTSKRIGSFFPAGTEYYIFENNKGKRSLATGLEELFETQIFKKEKAANV